MAVSPYHLTSNGPRVNTLVIDFATVPTRKTNMDLIVKFVHQNLKIQFSNVRSLQHNTGKALVFLECQTEDQAMAAVDINDGRHEIMVENIKYAVGVYMEDGATTVRIHDVSPQSENSVIEQALEKYGDVVWLKEETHTEPAILKGIKSGVRAVRMKIHTAIPSYINVRGEVTLVTYKNQLQTCRHCNKPVHWGRKCMEVSYMEMQLQTGNTGNISDRLRASGVDYAGALAAGSQVTPQASTSNGSGKGGKSLGANFTNLTQLFRSKQSSLLSKTDEHENTPELPVANSQRHNKTSTNTTTNTKSERSALLSKEINAKQTVSDQMDTSTVQPNSETPAIPLTNSFSELISDDDMDGNRSRSVSPSQKKRKGRSRNTSK